MKRIFLFPVLLVGMLLGSVLSGPGAQSSASPQSLFDTVQSLDTKLFDAYNHCDLTTVSSMVAEDLEFYHDVTGFSAGRQSLLDGLKENICGKVTRELVPGTLEVYPIAHYGAVEIGVHRFHHPGDPTNIGEAKFITLWQNEDGVWKITRALSFDHHPFTK
ncbi:MAG TPA: nuclear transport factor 2 family protein [Verrucomicrobiae bacterium]|jgi:ketosteroid isomerase-like protein|nr:nuclear transport factor 2 family protein [Verrucomicrobiae bacterium]